MKIATYNIWNNETNLLVRKSHILREIMEGDADVIAFQEVRDKVLAQELARNADYPTCYCQCFPDEEECLCIMSRLPVAASVPRFPALTGILVIPIRFPSRTISPASRSMVGIKSTASPF